MTLQCECGGAVEITSQSYPHDDGGRAFEAYRCVSCGRRGTYTFGDGGDRRTGCLTSGGY